MIGSLRGRLLERALDGGGEVLVEVAGVGYRIAVAPATATTIGELGDEVFLFVHHHIRDDAQVLYGFPTRDERACFEALVAAHGVGPALALAILSVHSPESLRRTLVDDDLASLCLVPGVGRKTAVRLLVELKSRLTGPGADLGAAVALASGAGPAFGGEANGHIDRSVRADVREALTGLGYGPDEIGEAVADLPADGDRALLLKQALRRLALVRS